MKLMHDGTKVSWLLVVALVSALPVTGCRGSGETQTPSASQTPATETESAVQPVDLANASCPVMGGPVTEGLYFDWNGFRIHICCGVCDDSFLQDPGQYLPALLQDESIDPAIRDSLRQFCESQGITLTRSDPASTE
jgi:hypothetical protein